MSETYVDNFKVLHKLPEDLFHLKSVFSCFNQGNFIDYCILNQFSLKENDHIISTQCVFWWRNLYTIYICYKQKKVVKSLVED